MIFLLALLGVFLCGFIVYANVRYWRELSRMTPDEYRMFKDEESKDMQNW